MKKTVKIAIAVVLVIVVGIVVVNLIRRPASDGSDCDKEYGLYTSNLDGSEMGIIISDSYRHMSHARVSPDKNWIAFTRFNVIGNDGCANEAENNYNRPGDQYFGTEIVLMRTNGSEERTIVQYKKDKISANSYWTPDGKGLIYVTAPNDDGESQINHLIFDSAMGVQSISKMPLNGNFVNPTDPHWLGDWVVFPATVNRKSGIWRIRYDGSGLEQLTWPKTQALGDYAEALARRL